MEMGKNYTVKPNQSMPDVIVQATGSMEASIQVCADNKVGISDLPAVGSSYFISNAALAIAAGSGGNEISRYLQQNKIVIGTLGLQTALNMRLVLYPKLGVELNAPGFPTRHPYSLVLGTDFSDGFVNVYDLLEYYLTSNPLYLSPELAYHPGTSIPQNVSQVTLMTSKAAAWKLEWASDGSYLVVWSNVDADIPTVTFKDVNGNMAYYSPLIILDDEIQQCIDCLAAEITVQLIGNNAGMCTVRIERSHPPANWDKIGMLGMSWIGGGFDYGPDPHEPHNANKIVAELPAGTYTIGVRTSYSIASVPFPDSAITIVFEVY